MIDHAAVPRPGSENRLVIAGRLAGRPELRVSPAGVPIVTFGLAHESEQPEAEGKRSVRFVVRVRAAGKDTCERLMGLSAGTAVTVYGYLAPSPPRFNDHKLVISARRIEIRE